MQTNEPRIAYKVLFRFPNDCDAFTPFRRCIINNEILQGNRRFTASRYGPNSVWPVDPDDDVTQIDEGYIHTYADKRGVALDMAYYHFAQKGYKHPPEIVVYEVEIPESDEDKYCWRGTFNNSDINEDIISYASREIVFKREIPISEIEDMFQSLRKTYPCLPESY